MGDAAGDVEAAQQSARELAGAKADEFLELHELDRLVHERASPGAVVHVERAEVVDVLAHGKLVDDRHLLRHDADPALEVVARGRHGLAEQADAAAVVGEQGEHAVDARGLARAVGAQQAEDLALVDVQVEVVEGEQLIVAFDEPLDRDDVHGSSAPPQFGTVPKLRFLIPCLLRTWCPTPSQRDSDNCHDLVLPALTCFCYHGEPWRESST